MNVVTGYEGLIFTVSIWREEENNDAGHPKAEVVKSSYFPFLDMEMRLLEAGSEAQVFEQWQLTPPSLFQSKNKRRF